MALHKTLAEHEADPPSGWQVVKAGERCWQLRTANGATLVTHATRKTCEAEKAGGWYVDLYEKEGRWMRGELVAGWRPFAEIVAERERRAARQEERYRGYAIHFVLDWNMDRNTALGATDEPTDENLAIVLGACVRPPHRVEYPAIRRHIAAYRAELEAQSAAACE